MYRKPITYKDYDGKVKTDDLWFHLKRTAFMEIAVGLPDNVTDEFEDYRAAENKDDIGHKIYNALGKAGVMKFIKDLILKSYGIRSRDGMRFEQSEEISYKFSQTLAFEQLYYDMVTDDDVLNEFFAMVIPKDETATA